MQQFFQKLTDFLEKEVVPIANQLDEDEQLYRDVYSRFVKLGVLNLLIPKYLGGLGGERHEWIDYNILLSQYSGALLFLQAQHQYCISRLKTLLPQPEVEEVLRSLACEGKAIGLALQKNPQLLKVTAVPEGFRLSGKFLWTTGATYFSHLLVSFEYENQLHYTLLPFETLQQEEGSITVLPKIETVVFNSITNNSVVLDQWLIPKSSIITSHLVKPKLPAEHPSIYNFAGAAKVLLNFVLEGRYGSTTEVLQQHALLDQAWDKYYTRLKDGTTSPLALRNEGLELVEQCSLLARISCGSAGILKSHPLGRILREIWQYTIAGYSEEQMRSYLKGEFFLG
ncbi:MAG: acyl-CoA/acyl-ACP dehydrogenase [Chthoniobacterales bacterium]|nr:acyl-CoA/acyl-ACP dehydrogenase [Chthoniobacterales bacterium]